MRVKLTNKHYKCNINFVRIIPHQSVSPLQAYLWEKAFWQLKNRKRVKLTRNLIRGLEIFKLPKPWPYKTPMPDTEQQEMWPGGALEDPHPKCDGCKRNRLTGARCSGSQSNRGRTGSVRGKVCTSVVFFFEQGPGSITPAAWPHGDMDTKGRNAADDEESLW